MRRDMELVRFILLRMEANPAGSRPHNLHLLGYSPQEIAYHCHMMMQDGLIEETEVAVANGEGAVPVRLTWKGHEFLDLARDLNRWNRARATVAEVGGAPLAVWMKILTDLLLKRVEATVNTR